MPGFNRKTTLAAVISLVAGTGTTAVKGVPESISGRAAVTVSLGGQPTEYRATQLRECRGTWLCIYYYRVSGGEGTSEDALADFVDVLEDAWRANRTLTGAVADSELDYDLANEPAYQQFAGQEYRVWPFRIITRTRLTG